MWGALIQAGASLAGGLMSNQARAESSDKQMAMQDYWLRNRHLIETQDLYAAGLNPILSAGGNPPVPPGSKYEAQDVVTPAVSTALQYRTVDAEVERKAQETALLGAQTEKALSEKAEIDLRVEKESIGRDTKVGVGDEAQSFWARMWEDKMRASGSESERVMHLALLARNENFIKGLEVDLLRRYGEEKARAVIAELKAFAASSLASAALHGNLSRSAAVDARISEIPGVREVERLIDAGRGATSAFRDFSIGQRYGDFSRSRGRR